jgi:small subunit ribosomal protein S1
MENPNIREDEDPPVIRSVVDDPAGTAGTSGKRAPKDSSIEGSMKDSSKDSSAEDKFDEMFREEFIKDLASFGEGQIVDGTVVGVTADTVFVDIGYKSEGEITLGEFNSKPSPGDRIRVMIVRTETRDGKLILSKQKADEIVDWDTIVRSYSEGLPVEGTVVDQVRGGYTVDVKSFKAFLPLSQSARTDDPKSLIGKVISFKIDKLDGKSNLVVSQRKYLDELREKKTSEFFQMRKEGDTVDGVVKNIVTYGAFIDLGGIDGLLHVNDISWSRVQDPKKYLKSGETITVKILSMDPQSKKISVGLKQLVPDPWDSFETRYEKGKKYGGVVKKLTNFGAFIELEEGIEGLLHVSELSWTKRVNHPKDIVKAGDRVEIMILDYDLSKKNVSLGLKQVLANPWDTIDEKFPVGSRVKTKIVNTIKSGVFVELDEGIEGFLGGNNISWTKQSKNLAENFKRGESLEIIILSIDKENRKIQVGLKQLSQNPWEVLKSLCPKGSLVTGKVTSVTDFGVFVKVSEEIEGLIHVSNISREKIESPASVLKVGDEVTAVILDIDQEKKKVTLSIKDYLNMQEKKDIAKYLEDDHAKTGSVPLGEIIDLSKIGK